MSFLNEGNNGNSSTGDSGNAVGGASGSSSGTQGATGTSQATSSGSSQTGASSWRDALPEELKSNPALGQIQDLPSLAKSYLHAQSLVGKKGVIPPNQNSSDEEWSAFYKTLGQPELEKFTVDAKGKQVAPEMLNKFKETAHKLGLLPKQAQGLYDFIVGQEEAGAQSRTQAAQQAKLEGLNTLKKEWGQGFDKEVSAARLAVREVGGQEFMEFLEKSGLGDDVNVIRAMAKFGKLLGEDRIRGEAGGRFGRTPAEVQNEIAKIQGDMSHPYYNKAHAGHLAALKQMEGLYQELYQDKRA